MTPVLLIHKADLQSRPVVIIVFAQCRSFVRPGRTFQNKQISSENNVRSWRECGSGRVDY